MLKLGEVPFGEMLAGMIGGRAGGLPRPLGSPTAFALGADRLYLGITDSASVAVFSLDGKRAGTIPITGAARAPTSEEYAAAAEIPLAIYPAQMRDAARKFILGAPAPDRMPSFSKFLIDPASQLWVQTSSQGERETRFRVFAADGRAIASLAIAADLNVFEVGADYVLGARIDADDEPHLTVYKLNRASRP